MNIPNIETKLDEAIALLKETNENVKQLLNNEMVINSVIPDYETIRGYHIDVSNMMNTSQNKVANEIAADNELLSEIKQIRELYEQSSFAETEDDRLKIQQQISKQLTRLEKRFEHL